MTTTTLDDEYGRLRPHAFHLQLPPIHKTEGGVPLVTIHAERKSRGIVRLARALEVRESFYLDAGRSGGEQCGGGDDDDDEEEEDEDDLAEDEDDGFVEGGVVGGTPRNLQQLTRSCVRLNSQLSSLSSLKHFGITREEVCGMILRLLGLLCATVEVRDAAGGGGGADPSAVGAAREGVERMDLGDDAPRRVTIRYEDVGYLIGGERGDDGGGSMLTIVERRERDGAPVRKCVLGGGPDREAEDGGPTDRPFALPPPARQALMSSILTLLGKKGTLRCVSNSAIYPDDGGGKRSLLVVHHRPLLRMLLRTAPYLDERACDRVPHEGSGQRSVTLKRTVTVIRSLRRFFDQGVQDSISLGGEAPGGAVALSDATARSVWSSVESDVSRTHSNGCFRALIVVYLFHPSRCSASYYLSVLPLWMEAWRQIDRCPEWDHLWLVLFSRARKYLPPGSYDWTGLLRHLLTHCGYWLQIPTGGASSTDRSFPRAVSPAKRTCPARLKAFVGSEGKYEEGMDFVGRLTKMIMFCAGPGKGVAVAAAGGGDGGPASTAAVSEGSAVTLRFLSFVTPYFNPSNVGAWTFPLGAFLHYLAYELCHRVGNAAGLRTLRADHPETYDRLMADEPYLEGLELPGNEVVAFLDRLLPLCQQALYSKNPNVSHAGETAMLYLVQIDPRRASPPLLDFGLRALDVSSVNLSHQAPAALSAISRLLQPTLRRDPAAVLRRLPDILRLTLAGIDSNDQNKSLRTLILYRNMAMWIPIGGVIVVPRRDSGGDEAAWDGTTTVGTDLMSARRALAETESYRAALRALPEGSLLALPPGADAEDDSEDDACALDDLFEEAMAAMSDWSLSFLDRIFDLLRAAGEQEKLGRGHGGVGMRHTSADVAMTRNFQRIMKETLIYVFSGMDDETYGRALRRVVDFVSGETLPFAVKDASLLCQAVCSTRFASGCSSPYADASPGLDALVPVLVEDIDRRSGKSAAYRLRCLAGAVRYAGSAVLGHGESIKGAIEFALSKKDDRVLFKTGCKLLRHTLASQVEEYIISQSYHPMRLESADSPRPALGASASLKGDRMAWHVPSGEQIDFAAGLIRQFTLTRLDGLSSESGSDGTGAVDLQRWRQSLRVLRYTLRGASGVLLDQDSAAIVSHDDDLCPKERATARLILAASDDTRVMLGGLRRRFCYGVLAIMSMIATDATANGQGAADRDQESQSRIGSPAKQISSDAKVCKETIELVELVATRRGAHYQSGTKKTIWRGQKELLIDFVVSSQSEFIASVLRRSNDASLSDMNLSYKDSENGGKTVPSALVVNRISLTNEALAGNASTQVPRRLRKLRGGPGSVTPSSVFSVGMSLATVQEHLGPSREYAPGETTLEAYEGLVDGLSALTCHDNINVRGDALGILDFSLTRFGWVAKRRLPRLVAAMSLDDDALEGVDGIPSCSRLIDRFNSQNKRTRLAECVKGVTKIIALPRVMKHFMIGEGNRFDLMRIILGTQKILRLVPQEEVPKIVHYANEIFKQYRSKVLITPRITGKDQAAHAESLAFLLGVLREGNSSNEADESEEAVQLHWRDRLLAAWFILTSVDEGDLAVDDSEIVGQIWSACFMLIEEETGQPLQRVALGLLGRLTSLVLVQRGSNLDGPGDDADVALLLRSAFTREKFLEHFAASLVFDHKADTEVGGGHSAQWSSGIEEVIRDSTANLSRRTLFPFLRIGQKSRNFKLAHSQLTESILLAIGREEATAASRVLLAQATKLVDAPPSEDQRNSQMTAAELFSGVARASLLYCADDEERAKVWDEILLPFLNDAILKMPNMYISAFFDAVRYAIHSLPPSHFFPLLQWSVAKIEQTCWQHETGNIEEADEPAVSPAVADRFNVQSKWLFLIQAILAELDIDRRDIKRPWYTGLLVSESRGNDETQSFTAEDGLGKSFDFVNQKLTPILLNALGHPYDKCRDHISSCLFRMCYCHQKLVRECGESPSGDGDPSIAIIDKLVSTRDSNEFSFREKVAAMGTVRKFISCCVHWGDTSRWYHQFLLPLLPITFLSLENIEGEVTQENRGLESDLAKGYRYTVADISSSCIIAYGVNEDRAMVLKVLREMSGQTHWQIRQAVAHFLRCFQGAHKFLLDNDQNEEALSITISMLADERREVSNAAMSTLTGILAASPDESLIELVAKYTRIANKSLKKKKRKAQQPAEQDLTTEEAELRATKERNRAIRQQKSVFLLCAVVMANPYGLPSYVPDALVALSKHSFEQRAALNVREMVKQTFADFRKTHQDRWDEHRQQLTQEQLEALEDVVSTPHYYVSRFSCLLKYACLDIPSLGI